MTGAMYAAIAGLKTHMQNLNVIGNNVANVNTHGYKSARAVFKTSIYTTLSGGSNGTQTIGGRNPSQIGYGANMGTIDIDMSSGNYSVTGKPTDMMIDGEGFFLVGSKDLAMQFTGEDKDVGSFSSLTLTRVGDFDIMPDGYLCKDMDGNAVYGFLCIGTATREDVLNNRAEKVGDPIFSDQLVPIRVPRVYRDDEGTMHIGYPRAGGGFDSTDVDIPEDVTPSTEDGKFTNDSPTTKHILDYGATFTPPSATDPGGVTESKASKASFSNLTVDQNTGIITATCGDLGDQVVTIGCIAIGQVTNPNGVTQIGDSYYRAQDGAGDLTISAMGGAGESMKINYVNGSMVVEDGNGMTNMTATDENATDGYRLRSAKGQILTNGLEMSKTDLAQEIANMIITQRGYQANTRIITVTDSMLEELVNMKR